MTLAIGTKIGSYEIAAPIGAGGMGEVYRARDTKLGRDVAIKVLPEAFARDAERMARFEREAKVLASLNHPNIAAIYGFEDSGSVRALVMELVEGPTLAERISSGGILATNTKGADLKVAATQPSSGAGIARHTSAGTQTAKPRSASSGQAGATQARAIPIEEALRIARQIADGLEYAHERSVVHRDLKPANIKISREDVVKILDFGLAKAIEGDAWSMDIGNSPTLTHMATQAGVLLGTASYMSPEQAKAKPVDRRADIWAFGCVLYEMLTGKMAFHGETTSDTLAAVIKEEPDWSLLPSSTPERVRVLLQRCLQKDPKQRLRDIGEARITLDEVLSGAPETASVAAAMMAPAPFWRRTLPWSLLGATAVALAIVAWAPWRAGTTRTGAALMRFEVPVPKNAQVEPTKASVFALSPDGRQLAFVASAADGGSQIWVRPLDSLEAHPLAGTESSSVIEGLIWSPDSRYIAFPSTQSGAGGSGELLKVASSGGPAEKICDFTGNAAGGSWSPNGVIILGRENGLLRVRASGGSPQALTIAPNGEEDAYPQLLPDGRHFLYTRAQSNTANVYIGSLDLPPGKQDSAMLLADSFDAVYVPSANGGDPDQGHLLFIPISGGKGDSRMAQPFDVRRLKLTGEAVPVGPGNLFSASANGVLAYRAGAATELQSLTWYDRQGKVLSTADAPSSADSVSLSPDGKRAFIFGAKAVSRLWLVDFARNATTPFTFPSSPAGEYGGDAVWSPDGSRVIFVASPAGGDFDALYEKPVSGATDERLILKSPGVKHSRCWSPDGRFLLYESYNLKTGRAEIWGLPLGGDAKPVPVLRGAFNVGSPQLSPEGHWMAYGSDESGRPEIFVREFSSNPGETSFTLGGEWQISTGGGVDARWGSDGKELYYRGLDGKVMAVEVATKPTFQPGPPRELFQGPPLLYPSGADVPSGWGIGPGGKRFIFQVAAGQSNQAQAPFTIVVNWQAGLKQ